MWWPDICMHCEMIIKIKLILRYCDNNDWIPKCQMKNDLFSTENACEAFLAIDVDALGGEGTGTGCNAFGLHAGGNAAES